MCALLTRLPSTTMNVRACTHCRNCRNLSTKGGEKPADACVGVSANQEKDKPDKGGAGQGLVRWVCLAEHHDTRDYKGLQPTTTWLSAAVPYPQGE